jgi:hypothetical protein
MMPQVSPNDSEGVPPIEATSRKAADLNSSDEAIDIEFRDICTIANATLSLSAFSFF